MVTTMHKAGDNKKSGTVLAQQLLAEMRADMKDIQRSLNEKFES